MPIDWIFRRESMPMKLGALINPFEADMLNRGLKFSFFTLHAIFLVGCADFEEIEIRREPSPDQNVIASLNRSSAGAFDSFSYFVILKGKNDQSRVAMIRGPKYRNGTEQIYLSWKTNNELVISAIDAERAELIYHRAHVDAREIEISLLTTNESTSQPVE